MPLPPPAGSSPRRVRFVARAEHAGLRLDQLLAANIPDLSRRQARVLLDLGGVFVDDARIKVASRMVRPGQMVQATLGSVLARATKTPGRAARAHDDALLPQFDVLFEDDDLVVGAKPSGLMVAPTAESDRGNLAALLASRPASPALWLVHRIDAPASGAVVFAKTPAATRALSRQFAEHTVEREYLVGARGVFPAGTHICDEPIGGKRAVTHVTTDRAYGVHATRVRCRLQTGRTHQIRIHLKQLGHPVMGDRLHGVPDALDPPRLALHAAVLAFVHPRTGVPVRFECPWPADLAAWTARLETLAGP